MCTTGIVEISGAGSAGDGPMPASIGSVARPPHAAAAHSAASAQAGRKDCTMGSPFRIVRLQQDRRCAPTILQGT
jgi:hypothetical protein